jgi:hypothetical protein
MRLLELGMTKIRGLVALLLLLAGACDAEPAAQQRSAVSPSPSPTVLEPLTLEASMTEPLARWTEVTFIPAGDTRDQIGIQRCFHCEITGVPRSFVVDDDGSFWIQDAYKDRIAHFAADGSFLDSISVLEGEAMSGLAVADGDVYVLLDSRRGILAHIQEGELVERITVNDAGDPLEVAELIGGQSGLLGLIVDAPGLGAYWAYATIDVPSGQITPAPGVLAAGGSYMDLGLGDEPQFREIRWSDGTALTATRKLQFQLVKEGNDVRTTAGEVFVETATSGGVAMVVGLGDPQGLPVGVWYLEIPEDGSKPIFERIPDDGENLRPFRRLVLGPDGAVYRMLTRDDGVHILRR